MTYWPFWAGGLALAGIALGHWLLVGRLMAVSGRFSELVDRLRFGPPAPAPALSEADLLAALQAATVDAFGPAAASPDAAPAPAPAAPAPEGPAPLEPAPSAADQPVAVHALFLLALLAGGLASSLLTGTFHVEAGLRGDVFARTFGGGWRALAPLLGGGVLVGFGTRMAGGCTSGHGLCGVSRGQPGSLLATAAFFGAGIAVSLLLGGAR